MSGEDLFVLSDSDSSILIHFSSFDQFAVFIPGGYRHSAAAGHSKHPVDTASMRQNIAGWEVAALTGASGPVLHAEMFPFVDQF